MNTKEKIAMKCTRAEYESIKEYIGDLKNTCDSDFDRYKYLSTPYDGVGQSSLLSKSFMDADRRVYKTFDKVVYLKACGIDPNKIIFDMVREHFKHAGDCISVAGRKFNARDYDFDKMDIFFNGVFVLPFNAKDERYGKTLYNVETKEFATITSLTRSRISDSILTDFNPVTDPLWLKTWSDNQLDQKGRSTPYIKTQSTQNGLKGPVQLTRADIENILGYEIKIIKDE